MNDYFFPMIQERKKKRQNELEQLRIEIESPPLEHEKKEDEEESRVVIIQL